MKITAIRAYQNNFKIFLDNNYEIEVSGQIILDQKLQVGLEVSQSTIHHIKDLLVIDKYYWKAIQLISLRLRTENEIVNYLKKFSLNSTQITSIIDELKKNNYLDNQKFIKSYINDSINLNLKSKKKIKHELINKGFLNDDINQLLDQYDDMKSLQKLINKKLKLTRFRNNQQKLIKYLINQGFVYSDIQQILNQN